MKASILKVAGNSNVLSVAGSIVKAVEDGNRVELHSIGASSVNQTVKAIATARGILATKGYDALVKIGVSNTVIEGDERTLMKFIIVID